MSRIGKKPIEIPEGVQVKIEGNSFSAKGDKGEVAKVFPLEIEVKIEGNKILVCPKSTEKKQSRALWGTWAAILKNAVNGVKTGFEKKLEIQGLGYRASLTGQTLELFVGFTHSVRIEAPEGVKFSLEKNIITVSGADLERVASTASSIKKVNPPEPYKGKGIRYVGEYVRKKEGKKAATAASPG